MKNSSVKVFEDTLVLNFGSRYAGWADDVRLLLTQFNTWEQTPFLTIPWKQLSKRLNEIKYICLVGRFAITETCKVFPFVPGRKDENSEKNDLERLLARMQDAPEHDDEEYDEEYPEEERDKDVLEEEEDFPWDSSNKDVLEEEDFPWDSSNIDVEDDHGISSQFPYYGGTTDESEVTVIVDCYGIYVRSLKDWLDGFSNQYLNRTMNQWKERLADRSIDGPAILLCPELIETIYRTVMRRASLPIRKILTLDVNPSRLFLKFTLLHEIGHHVFPVCTNTSTRYLSEAMANWFVYCAVSPQERAILHEKTQTQTLP